jgi:hypothetical protein
VLCSRGSSRPIRYWRTASRASERPKRSSTCAQN